MRASSNPVKHVRDYYRSQLKPGQSMWWIDDDSDKTPVLSTIINSLSSLSDSEKNALQAEAFIMFPEIFSNSTSKYEKVAVHWASNHGLISSNLRDIFTSGGQVTIGIGIDVFSVPKVVYKLACLADKVHLKLQAMDETNLSNSWLKKIENYDDSEGAWKQEIDKQSLAMDLPIKLSLIYDASLEGLIRIQ